MIDPLLSLAFTMQANKGTYALLLGSGVSRAAQIPTGWEIVENLITRIARLQSEDCTSDAVQWYRAKYGQEPDYSKLLADLAKSQVERHQLLRRYFEPNEEEREQGLKLPTAAHRAIGELVVRGYVRVIITTNFDRLTERAIEDAGVTPTVISTPDAVQGALPLVHQHCCVIKLHGDYLDTRIKNSPKELEKYDRRTKQLLDRILDEFGIVACGWSAEWDTALCAAFERCRSRRFTLYWALRGNIGDRADRLVKMHAGTTITIADADSFFSELSEKVFALDETQRPHPLSVSATAATLKRLVSEERHFIRLHDVIREETESAYAAVSKLHDKVLKDQHQDGAAARSLNDYFDAIAIVRELMIYGCRWANPSQYAIFSQCIPQLARDPERQRSGVKIISTLRCASAAMLFYAGGLSATAGRNYGMLAHLFTQSICRDDGREGPFLVVFHWNELHRFAVHIPECNHQYAADSLWMFKRLRDPLRALLPDDAEYAVIFDRFEYLRGMVYLDLEIQRSEGKELNSEVDPGFGTTG